MDKGKGVKVELNEEKPGQEASTGIQVTPGGDCRRHYSEENSSCISEGTRAATAGGVNELWDEEEVETTKTVTMANSLHQWVSKGAKHGKGVKGVQCTCQTP